MPDMDTSSVVLKTNCLSNVMQFEIMETTEPQMVRISMHFNQSTRVPEL